MNLKNLTQTKIIQKSSEVRIFRDATLITPGTWTDSVSRRPITYRPNELMQGSKRWISNYLNLDHDWSIMKLAGTVQNVTWKDNAVKGDLYINTKLSAGREAVTAIDLGLVKALSVELQSSDTYDNDTYELVAGDIDFLGCAIVYGDRGACSDARI